MSTVFSYSTILNGPEILLIVDNAPAHLPFFGDLHLKVKWYFSLQPMHKNITTTFKVYYLRNTIVQAIAESKEDNEKTLRRFQKDCNIYDGILNLAWAWDEVTKEWHLEEDNQ